MRRNILLLVIAVVCTHCTPKKEMIPPIASDESSGKVIIYQVMTRLFGNKNTTNKTYGTRDENGVGKFNDINDAALKSIRNMGITHVWYTGVIEHATLTDYSKFGIPADDADVVKGRAGSPYAIKDYYDVAPDLAVDVTHRMEEFEQLVERTHANGLKVLMDFVPNHVARAYKSDVKPKGVKDLGEEDNSTLGFSAKNNFYYLPGQSFQPPHRTRTPNLDSLLIGDGKFAETPAKATGNDQFVAAPTVNDWYETIKLNYGVDIQNNRQKHFDPTPDTWVKMRDILLYWASKKVDGFRCDMAEMVPVEFWHWVIPQIKLVNPEIIFIAEIYNPAQYNNYIEKGNFSYLYDKVQLYDTLRLLLTGERGVNDIHPIQQSLAPINRYLVHFLENHDEQRLASKYFAGDIWKAIPAMVISSTIDKGAVMIYFGQEVGEPAIGAEGFAGDDGRTTIFDYWGVPEHQRWMNDGKFDGDSLNAEQKQLRQFYSELLNLAGKSEAISHGEYVNISDYNIKAGNFNDKVMAYIRYSGDERFLIIATFNDVPQAITIKIPPETVGMIGLDLNATYIARDMLWHEAEVGFGKDFSFGLQIKPYSSYIFKIK